ncbi:MAG: ABC transporter ATP-binding protein [Caldilineaceae bacterium]
MSELRRLLSYLRPYWQRVVGAIIGLIGSSLITLTLPLAIRYLVDSIFLQRDFGALNLISIGLFALFLIQAVVSYSYRFLLQWVAQRAISDLRIKLHQRLLVLPLQFYTNHRVGDIVSRMSNDVTTLEASLVSAPVGLMRQFLTVGGGLALMIWLNWRLTILILLLIPPLMLVATFYGKRLKKLSALVQDRRADATVILEEMLSGVRVVKSFVREQFEAKRYGAAVEASFDSAIERIRQRSIFVPLISVLGFAAIVLLLWAGGRQVIAGTMTPGELIAYLFYMVFVSGPMAESANLWGQLQEAIGATQRVFEIMDTAAEPGTVALPRVAHNETAPLQANPVEQGQSLEAVDIGQVRFVDVSFRYENEDSQELPVVLSDINLTAEPGQVVALVGYSGAGKTTLVNLIPRFYEPTGGHIEIDGQDICSFSTTNLRSRIGLVPQETFLFGGTIRENIAYGRLDATDAEIQAAAEAAYAHDFISQLPKQYHTVVGERGIKLSAGQRQRIAIARALLKNPRILILDEATSALDTESERWVQAALERLMEGRTSFVIAHRLSTIQRADLILVLDQGRIVERGTHESLLADGKGLYQRLYAMQFSDFPLKVNHDQLANGATGNGRSELPLEAVKP